MICGFYKVGFEFFFVSLFFEFLLELDTRETNCSDKWGNVLPYHLIKEELRSTKTHHVFLLSLAASKWIAVLYNDHYYY